MEDMGQVKRRPGAFKLGIVDIQEWIEAGLRIAQRIAKHLGPGIVRLQLQPVTIPMAQVDLQGVITGVAVVGKHVGAENIWVGEKADRSIQAIRLVKSRQGTRLTLVNVGAHGAVGQ